MSQSIASLTVGENSHQGVHSSVTTIEPVGDLVVGPDLALCARQSNQEPGMSGVARHKGKPVAVTTRFPLHVTFGPSVQRQ
jgi:hypothetical protein